MTDRDEPVVLIAEDERDVAEGYELWLGDRYEVRLAADGREALDAVDDSVDVVLLDRMMPELSGKEVLREIRERGIDCRVAMVTAVEADFDVIGMGFDAYITKPPERRELIDTIERLLDRAAAEENLRTYHSLMARKGALETQKTEDELAESDEYRELLDRIEAARNEADDALGDMGSETEFVSAVQDLAGDAGSPDDDSDGFGDGPDGFEGIGTDEADGDGEADSGVSER